MNLKNKISRYAIIAFLFIINQTLSGQSIEKEAMSKLSFMIGNWKGSGTSFPEKEGSKYDVLSKVTYDLDGELLVLRHRSFREATAVLSLHTVIYYNKEDQYYYYNAYTKRGSRPFKGKITNDKLVLYLGENYRLIFQKTEEGKFNEYGEKLVDNKWIKNFEDILSPTSEITSF